MHAPPVIPVLVIGAGPAGLATAIELGRRGVECLVVDRRLERSSLPRATTISLRSMELVRSWGLEDEVLAGGIDVEWLMWESPTIVTADAGTPIEVGMPTRAQAALISPTAPACVPQDHLERVLLDHLRALGPVRVELGTTFAGLEDRGDHVRVRLRDAAGRERVVTAGHVVAADGARSAVRHALGIAMRGSQELLSGITAVTRAPLWAVLGQHRYGIYVTTEPGREGVFLPAGPGDRWGFGWLAPAGAGAPEVPDDGTIVERMRQAAGIADLPVRIERTGSFTSAAQIADRFRAGRSFLVGDAAHRVTPRGGTGMNTAIRGGHDLGWKLAWVARGWAGPELLDAYEAEHRPIAEHNVARSADELGSRRPSGEELRVDLAGRIDHHWVMRDGGAVSTLDLLGPGLTLFTGPRDAGWQEAAGQRADGPPMAVHRLDEMTARAMGIRSGGALLVRPDGVQAGWWDAQAEPGRELARAA
jgi:putative polyketide hydroxylase